MRACAHAMVAMVAVIFLSGWFLLGGIAAAAGLNCSGGNDCSSASDEMAPYLGVLLVAFAATAPTVLRSRPLRSLVVYDGWRVTPSLLANQT